MPGEVEYLNKRSRQQVGNDFLQEFKCNPAELGEIRTMHIPELTDNNCDSDICEEDNNCDSDICEEEFLPPEPPQRQPKIHIKVPSWLK